MLLTSIADRSFPLAKGRARATALTSLFSIGPGRQHMPKTAKIKAPGPHLASPSLLWSFFLSASLARLFSSPAARLLASPLGAMANMNIFIGTWRLDYNQNFLIFLAELGIGAIVRGLRNMAREDTIISRNDNTFTIKTKSTFKNSEFSFKLGEKFDENTIDGRKTQTLITLDDNNVLTQVQQWDGKECTITRKVDDGKLIVLMVRDWL
ncbi:fatty acid-binding protein 5-like isoform X2 [Pantherophis guttatus]|uniref:Fatty acid-binding protein 5-like isoform X2 n=1 Tax=Pantherophis guttatus TaxID=94885 RepID=A0ABM3YP53_PANGU|nr:fatty acid-binding protein 5-like isoform X2 [Pantherophis guttatus]